MCHSGSSDEVGGPLSGREAVDGMAEVIFPGARVLTEWGSCGIGEWGVEEVPFFYNVMNCSLNFWRGWYL